MPSTPPPPASWTAVDKKVYWEVVDHCYLCDMCFMTKCPYVPPHPWNVDFPHLMLRAKATRTRKEGFSLRDRVLASTDSGRDASPAFRWSPKWSTRSIDSAPARALLEKTLGVDPRCAAAEVSLPHRPQAPVGAWRLGRCASAARRGAPRPACTPASETDAAGWRCSRPATATATSRTWPTIWSRCSSTTTSRCADRAGALLRHAAAGARGPRGRSRA